MLSRESKIEIKDKYRSEMCFLYLKITNDTTSILPSYLFGQPCLFGQYENDVIGEPAHVLIPSNFTPQYFKSQQIKENPKE